MNNTDLAPAMSGVEYNILAEGAAVYDASANGRLRLTQRDRNALLHRLSTNDIERLKPGDGTRTVLINHNARIIDLLTIYALPEHLLVTTSPGQAGAVESLLRKNIFFMDRVTLEDLSATTVELHLYGRDAAARAMQITGVDPTNWTLHHVQAVTITAGDRSAQGWLARIPPLGGDGLAFFAEVGDRDVLLAALADVPVLTPDVYDVLRVEQGYPAFGHELSLDYIPLETRLVDAVSFTKGCYVGQEIIARMDSRQRLAKQLMGLRLTQAVPAGGKLRRDGKEMGDLTSVVTSPRLGPIGLAYVRTAAAVPGTEVEVGEGVSAQVVELPFE